MPLKLKGQVVCAGLLLLAAPALADVKAGVDAWSRGDYTKAVSEWQGPAAAGDPDAMFNLAQAYRMGRGIAADSQRAEALYAQAAAVGHVQAADTYGLLLFQEGKREAALPYVQDAARRGDPRSQYLLGVAHFNGDLLPKDWVKAYALVTLANAAGLPQSAGALAQMDASIPLGQRQQAASLAQQMRAEAEAARSASLASVDLAALSPGRSMPPASRVAVSPSIAAARAAIAEASRATGTESPANAGASFARPPTTREVPVATVKTPSRASEPQVAVAAPAPKSVRPVAAASGPWRVQLGAFSVAANAERLWQQVSARAELSGKQRVAVASGGVTRLQAGGFASRDAAEAACASLKRDGHACLVTAR